MAAKREHPAVRAPHRAPTHPGAVLREDVLPALGISISQAARDLGVSRQLLHGILAERVSISPEMALRIGKLCGNGPDLWLRMQIERDLWEARNALRDTIAAIPTRRQAA
jgi:addiction module HigA family antidote